MFPGPDSIGFVWGGVRRALHAVYAFSGLSDDPVVSTLRGASGDLVTIYV